MDANTQLARLTAYMEIRQTLARYCRGVDRRDAALLKTAYHPDATDDHGNFKGSGHDFADWIVNLLPELGFGYTTHQITNVLVKLADDVQSAAVETYYASFHPGKNDAGEQTMFIAGGRYLDRFECREGNWKIAQRLCTVDWARSEAAVPDWPGITDFTPIGFMNTDPSYAIFHSIA